MLKQTNNIPKQVNVTPKKYVLLEKNLAAENPKEKNTNAAIIYPFFIYPP